MRISNFIPSTRLVKMLRGQCGFTLLETVLALVILGMTLLIMLSGLRLGMKSWEKGDASVEHAVSTRSIYSKLARDLSAIYPYRVKEGDLERFLFDAKEKSFGFVTTDRLAVSGLAWGGVRWVQYSLRDRELIVNEEVLPSTEISGSSGKKQVELESDIRDLRFEYFDDARWMDEWNADHEEGIPSAIRVTITYEEAKESLVITVPVRAATRKGREGYRVKL